MKSFRLRRFAWALGLAVWVGAPVFAAEGLTLAHDGRAMAAILVDADASASERWAAEELQKFLKEMSGAEFSILSPDAAHPAEKAGAFVILGKKMALKRRPDLKVEDLGDEGFIIISAGNELIVAGGEKRGTLYGVYTLLEKLGCRWWTPTESTIPKTRTIEVPPTNVREVPKFEYRDMLFLDMLAPDDNGTLWSVRNKLNGPGYKRLTDKQGGEFPADSSLIHSYYDLLAVAKSVKYDEHQDMWALYQGKRNRVQPCLMNPDVEKAVIESVREKLRQRPGIAFVTVGQNDGAEHCECEKCKALSEAEGTTGAPVIDLANRVAENLARDFPNAIVNTSAYAWSRKPPEKLKPRDNVMVSLSSIETDFGHPLVSSENTENVKFREDITNWNKVARRLYIWDYSTNFGCWLVPWPNLDVIVPNIKFYADHKAKGYFVQGSHTGRMTEFSPLRMWVLSKAMWNPDSDGKALIDEFLNGYYGPAADSIRKYIDTIHRPVRDDMLLHVPCDGSSTLEGPWLEPGVIAEAESQLREAEKKVEGDAILSKRVRHAHMPIWYLLVMRDLLFEKSGRKSPLRLAVEAKVGLLDFGEVALNFVRTAKEAGVNSSGEHKELGQWVDWLADYAKTLKQKGAVLPPELQGAGAKAPIVIHAGMMNVPDPEDPWIKQHLKGAPMGFRKDPGTSDGWAYDTGTNEWFVQFALTAGRDYDPGTKYKLFVRAIGGDEEKGGARLRVRDSWERGAADQELRCEGTGRRPVPRVGSGLDRVGQERGQSLDRA